MAVPKVKLEALVEAAADIASADGIDAVTMRRLAERCGVGVMTIYGSIAFTIPAIPPRGRITPGLRCAAGAVPRQIWRERMPETTEANPPTRHWPPWSNAPAMPSVAMAPSTTGSLHVGRNMLSARPFQQF